MNTPNPIEVRALQVSQDGSTPLFTFFMRGSDLLKIAEISRVSRDKDGELLGYQRKAVTPHINEIIEYLNAKDVLFPNAVILAFSTEVRFRQSRGPQVGDEGCQAGVLEIPVKEEGPKVAWLVDGQQRSFALSKSSNQDILVPVTAFVSDDFEVHRTQFLLVNKVRPLPKGLINELLPVVNTLLPPSLARNKIPSFLCDLLQKDPDSPFHEIIIRETTDRKKDKRAVIADTGLIHVIRTSLNSIHGCLYQYRNVATGETDVEGIHKVLNLYWNEVRRLFPDAWGLPPAKSRLMHGVGIKGMGILMDRVMYPINPRDPKAPEQIRASLKRIKTFCAWTSGNWVLLNDIPWNALQNTSGHVRLLANMLVRVFTGIVNE
jgi:DGQHR domain-containing protein